jgi:hypothetical protein
MAFFLRSPACRAALLACVILIMWPAAQAATTKANLLVRVAGAGAEDGKLDIIGAGGRVLGSLPLRCDRVHTAAGTVACLRTVPGQGLQLDLADRHGAVLGTLKFPNVLLASRVRVSKDGATVAFTGFGAGHTYSGTNFSTRTYLVDFARRRLVADVSTFKVIEANNLTLPAKRINVWGVTFDPTSSTRFYATVGAGGAVFLAAGDLKARTLTLTRAEMECPSLSPDGTRIAFKRRNPAGGWFPAVYEIASGREWVMKEGRSLDDQIEWIDDTTLVYELSESGALDTLPGSATDVVTRGADGKGASTVLRKHVGSPSVFN